MCIRDSHRPGHFRASRLAATSRPNVQRQGGTAVPLSLVRGTLGGLLLQDVGNLVELRGTLSLSFGIGRRPEADDARLVLFVGRCQGAQLLGLLAQVRGDISRWALRST